MKRGWKNGCGSIAGAMKVAPPRTPFRCDAERGEYRKNNGSQAVDAA